MAKRMAIVNENFFYWTGSTWGNMTEAKIFNSFDALSLVLKNKSDEYYLDMENRTRPKYTDSTGVIRARAIPVGKY